MAPLALRAAPDAEINIMYGLTNLGRPGRRQRQRHLLTLASAGILIFPRPAECYNLPSPGPTCTTLSVNNAGQEVDGTIPTEFGYCTLVTDFTLGNNAITGSVYVYPVAYHQLTP